MNLPKTLTAAFMRELRMLVKDRVLTPRDIRQLLGVNEIQIPRESGGSYIDASEAAKLFADLKKRFDGSGEAQGHLPFGGAQ